MYILTLSQMLVRPLERPLVVATVIVGSAVQKHSFAACNVFIADDCIYLTVLDDSDNEYAITHLSLLSEDNIVLARYTSPTPLAHKRAGVSLVLPVAFQFPEPVDTMFCAGVATILPPFAEPLEKRIEATLARTASMPVDIAATWHPATCPPHILPWLAWAMSVDNWNNDWSLAAKRRVIAASAAVHRKKGTLGSIRRALNALGIAIEIIERPEGRPFEFIIKALGNETLAGGDKAVIDRHFFATVRRLLAHLKPARCHYALQVGANFRDLSLSVASTLRARTVQREHATTTVWPVTRRQQTALTVAASAQPVKRCRAVATIGRIIRRHSIAAVAACRVRTILTLRMEAI